MLGVDIGGTKIAAGLVNPGTGEIRAQVKLPMNVRGDAQTGFAAVTSAIDLVLEKVDVEIRAVAAIGLCAPGPLDPGAGVVLNPPNVPCWRNFALAPKIADVYGRPARLDNDANAAALAETMWGAGRGYANVFYATLGTGIGTGIVLDGKVLHGRTGAAGEGGHVSIDFRGPQCACGKRGCIEVFAAGPAIAKAARRGLEQERGAGRMLLGLAGGQAHAITCEMVAEAYAQGDAVAKRVLEQTIEYLSFWLGNIVDLLEPEIIILGGGVGLMLRPFLQRLRQGLPKHCENQRAAETPLTIAHYGEGAGIAGAAALCVDL